MSDASPRNASAAGDGGRWDPRDPTDQGPADRAVSVAPLRHLETDLAELSRLGLQRVPPASIEPEGLVLCSNDYLGYAGLPLEPGVGGSGASRLISGNCAEHLAAEDALAAWVGLPAALVFSSGYAANVGALTALVGPEDLVVSDELNHASIIDGCRLSRARVVVTRHLDVDAVGRALDSGRSARRRWVVTEGYFSMDGDIPDLARLRSLCDGTDSALVVDEAHALGVLGPAGRGACAAAGIAPDVLVGTLGKALGLQGAFVAGSEPLRRWLWNRARSFVFSTGLSPAIAGTVPGRVARAAADDGGRARMRHAAARLRAGLEEQGIRVSGTPSLPVLPWIVGGNHEALVLSQSLRAAGVLVQAIRPPTVPAGSARLRLTATASLRDADIEHALRAFAHAAAGR